MLSFLKREKSTDILWSYDEQYLNAQGNKNIPPSFETVCEVKKRPDWWKNSSLYVNKIKPDDKSIYNFVDSNWHKIMANTFATLRTIKACPAMQNQINQSILIKNPADIFLETTSDGRFRYSTLYDFFAFGNDHPSDQYPGADFENHILLKLKIPILFTSENNMAFYHDCVLEKVQPWKVVPGPLVLNGSIQPMNLFMIFPKENKKYVIPANSPLAYITFTNRFKKVIYDSTLPEKRAKKVMLSFNSLFTQKGV